MEALLEVEYIRLVEHLSDCGPFEVELGNQIAESYKDHEASRSYDSLANACVCINNVRDYIDHKNELFADPALKQATKTFDITLIPTTYMTTIAALAGHPMSGTVELHLSDKLIYSSSLMINDPGNNELEISFYTAQDSALAHLQTISEWSFPEETINHELPMTLVPGLAVILEACTLQESPTILPDLLKPNTSTNLDLSESSFDGTNIMGEGRDGSSHSPLPKVLGRSEEESLQLSMNHWKEEYLPMVALPPITNPLCGQLTSPLNPSIAPQ